MKKNYYFILGGFTIIVGTIFIYKHYHQKND